MIKTLHPEIRAQGRWQIGPSIKSGECDGVWSWLTVAERGDEHPFILVTL